MRPCCHRCARCDQPAHRPLFPDVESFIVSRVDGHQQALFRQLQHLGQETPCKLDGILLEVVAKAEVAQHFEEGVVTSGIADVFQIVVLTTGTHATLGSRRAIVGTLVRAKEHVLNWFIPALVNNRVGSLCGTSELEETTWCPWERKYSRNAARISDVDIYMENPA